jgi:ribose transport system substrate-binding protein
MAKDKRSSIFKKIGIILCILLILVCIFALSKTFSSIKQRSLPSSDLVDSSSYHVLVVGTSKNAAFLKELYKGAATKGPENNAVVELYVPESRAEDVPLQTLLNYAGYESVDGVIAYINSDDVSLIPPFSIDGNRIPLISVGYYEAKLPQISYIGTGYFEMGRIFAQEIIAYLHNSGNCLIINSHEKNDSTYSSLMSGLQNDLSKSKNIHINVFDINSSDGFSVDDRVRQKIATLKNIDVLVSLSQEATIRTTEAVIDTNKAGKIGIIGVQESDEVRAYLDKGIITVLLSFNPAKIGETAMNQLFEYKKNGSANSYIMSDITVLRGEKK